MTDKQIALEIVKKLPDTAMLAEILERLKFLKAVKIGLDQIDRGATIPHAQVKRELASSFVT